MRVFATTVISVAVALLVAAACAPGPCDAADVFIKYNTHEGVLHKRVKSMKELRFKEIVRQQTDYSCGAAALATVLKYRYDEPDADEERISRWIIENGDRRVIMEKGFSLLDLKRYAESLGYEAAGFKVNPVYLHQLQIPTIALLNIDGYAHFVVLKGVMNRTAYIADPALGNRTMPVTDFIEAWNGLVLAVHKRGVDADYERFGKPLSIDKASVMSLSDQLMRNLFINPSEFRR